MISRLRINLLILIISVILTFYNANIVTASQPNNNSESGSNDVLTIKNNFYSDIVYSGLGKKIPITGNINQLKSFFNSLKQSKNSIVRIAHFGDSIILGDIISEGLRDNLQKLFGGNGAGFIGINTEDYGMRKTTTVSFSNDWTEASLFKRNPNNLPLGINGCVFAPANGSYAKYDISRLSNTLKYFKTVRLYYLGEDGSCSFKYQFNNSQVLPGKLVSNKKVNEIVMKSGTNATSIRLDFTACPKTYFYGLSLENGNGVYVDNFPMRGQSGIQLTDITLPVLKDFNNLMDYNLIILNYGVNVVSPEHSDYTWYEVRMEKVINYLKSAFPDAGILIVSVGDKSIKKGTKFITDPGIPLLLKAQKNLAEKTNVAFWNLYEVMGGKNSIEDWVNAKPQLALKDYCHLTSEGGNLVADLLTEALINEFNKSK